MCTKTKVMLGVSLGLLGVAAAGALISLGVCTHKAATEKVEDDQAKDRMVGEGGHEGGRPA
jgi:fructose-specific phosphotransferase system IIC component